MSDAVRPGDSVVVNGKTVTIFNIYEASYEPWMGWEVEFTDTNGKYRHWRQRLDGGELVRKKGENHGA